MTMTTPEALAVLLREYAYLCHEGMNYEDPETLHRLTGEVCRLSTLRRRFGVWPVRKWRDHPALCRVWGAPAVFAMTCRALLPRIQSQALHGTAGDRCTPSVRALGYDEREALKRLAWDWRAEALPGHAAALALLADWMACPHDMPLSHYAAGWVEVRADLVPCAGLPWPLDGSAIDPDPTEPARTCEPGDWLALRRIAAEAQGVAPALVLVLLAHWFRQSEQCPGLSVYAAHWTAARREGDTFPAAALAVLREVWPLAGAGEIEHGRSDWPHLPAPPAANPKPAPCRLFCSWRAPATAPP
jgi:hypothetical protein